MCDNDGRLVRFGSVDCPLFRVVRCLYFFVKELFVTQKWRGKNMRKA